MLYCEERSKHLWVCWITTIWRQFPTQVRAPPRGHTGIWLEQEQGIYGNSSTQLRDQGILILRIFTRRKNDAKTTRANAMEELTKEFNGKIQSIKFSLEKKWWNESLSKHRSDIKTRSAIDVKIAGRSHSERIHYVAEICKWRITGAGHHLGERARDISKRSGQKGSDLAIRQQVAIKGCLINPRSESRISDLRPGRSTRYLLRRDDWYWSRMINQSSLTLLPMNFCRSTLFEAGRDLFMKNWQIYSRKISMVFIVKSGTLTRFVAFEEHMVDRCLAEPS